MTQGTCNGWALGVGYVLKHREARASESDIVNCMSGRYFSGK